MKLRLLAVALVLWAVASVIIVGTLMVGHTAAMPGPGNPEATDRALYELVDADSSVVHVIPANCSCTDGLVRHLVARGSRSDVAEHVVFVGDPSPLHREVEQAGYTMQVWSADELEPRLGLQAGPVLAVRSAGQLMYLGGYFQYPAAVRSLDESLVEQSLAGEQPDALPLFGCAVSAELRSTVDPLGLGS